MRALRSWRRPALAALAVTTTLAVPAATAAPSSPECNHLFTSPTVATDRVLFCVKTSRPITVAHSTDLGRTWLTVRPLGFLGHDEEVFNGLVLSPAYSADKTAFLQTKEALYATTDAGATLIPIDPAGGAVTLLPSITAMRRIAPVLAGPLPTGVLLAQAFQVAPPDLLLPPQRTKAPGTPGGLVDTVLVAPPGEGPYGGTVLAVGREVKPTPPTVEIRRALFACDLSLLCSRRLSGFPANHILRRIELSPDFARTGVIHALTSAPDGATVAWVSRDGGAHLERLPSVERIVAGATAGDGVVWGLRVVSDPRNPRRLYLRLHAGKDGGTVPAEQMFRSDDEGRTWTRIGYFRLRTSPHAAGPRGWPGPGFTGSPRDAESMLVLSDGRILAIGDDGTGKAHPYCSTDGARTWAPLCRR